MRETPSKGERMDYMNAAAWKMAVQQLGMVVAMTVALSFLYKK
jgi:hypothetical protein